MGVADSVVVEEFFAVCGRQELLCPCAMATLMKGLSAPGRAKVGVADSGEALVDGQSEASDAEPLAAPAAFEAEPAPKKPEPGASVAATMTQVHAQVGAKLKGQAVTSGGPDMEKILRQGFVRKV